MSNISIQINIDSEPYINEEIEKLCPAIHIKIGGIVVSNFVLNSVQEFEQLKDEINKAYDSLRIVE